jgi:hypothetical protein
MFLTKIPALRDQGMEKILSMQKNGKKITNENDLLRIRKLVFTAGMGTCMDLQFSKWSFAGDRV